MQAILITVLPVFGMIVVGYVMAKLRIVEETAAQGLTQFVFNLAIPAQLFRTVVGMPGEDASPWGFWFAYFAAIGINWIVTASVARQIGALSVSGGAAASMATGFGNIALLGMPLALAHFGPAAAVPAGLIISVHAPLLWLAATFHRETSQPGGGAGFVKIGRELVFRLATNAIILALVAAGLWRLTGLGLHPVPDRMLAMLSDASIPTALVALGLSLSGFRLRGQWSAMLVLIGLKMVLAPALVFLMLRYAVTVPPLWLKVGVLLAAMPTGANAFLFAHRHGESVAAVTGAVAVGTGLAAITASILLYLMDAGLL